MNDQTKDKIRVQRANLVVSNLEQSYTFYCHVLGFELTFEKESEADSYSYDVFSIDTKHKMRFAILSTASQPRSLALTEISAPTLPATPTPIRATVVLDVADVDAVVEGSKLLGLKVYHEDALITHDGREGREVGIIDHDGNLVVIYNIPTAQ
jgi:catechol 2,3-dioxygenase-like lactoylglutathione lyase family enzyme